MPSHHPNPLAMILGKHEYSMSPAPEVIIHDINCTDDWPECVSSIHPLFTRPCLKHLISDDVRNALSSGACAMYDELLLSPLLEIEDKNVADKVDTKIADILDILLSSVQLAKSTIFLPSGEVQLRSSWTSIIAFLGIAVSEGVFVT